MSFRGPFFSLYIIDFVISIKRQFTKYFIKFSKRKKLKIKELIFSIQMYSHIVFLLSFYPPNSMCFLKPVLSLVASNIERLIIAASD